MKAWQLDWLGGELRFTDVPIPEPRPGSVLVKIEASALMSYLKAYVEGRLPAYLPPPGPFTIGTNGVGVVAAVGRDVWHLKPGQRVVLSSHFVAPENVEDPAQVLIGLTSSPQAAPVLADWPDGTLAEYALLPVAAVTPAHGLDTFDAAQLVTIGRCIIPFGGLLRGRLAVGESVVVNGSTGAYGTAAVLVAVAMGAARVIAAGRNARGLQDVARAGGPRDILSRNKSSAFLPGGPADHSLLVELFQEHVHVKCVTKYSARDACCEKAPFAEIVIAGERILRVRRGPLERKINDVLQARSRSSLKRVPVEACALTRLAGCGHDERCTRSGKGVREGRRFCKVATNRFRFR